jgi:hypothetical protein
MLQKATQSMMKTERVKGRKEDLKVLSFDHSGDTQDEIERTDIKF